MHKVWVRHSLIASAATITATTVYYNLRTELATAEKNHGAESFEEKIPSRVDMVKKLQEASVATNPYDVLIIGGGATGSGAALVSPQNFHHFCIVC
jgi:alkyl hydroperoxide reductase subunit AhpF